MNTWIACNLILFCVQHLLPDNRTLVPLLMTPNSNAIFYVGINLKQLLPVPLVGFTVILALKMQNKQLEPLRAKDSKRKPQ